LTKTPAAHRPRNKGQIHSDAPNGCRRVMLGSPPRAYLYLMRQSYATGQVLVVDGGALLA